MIEIIPAIMPKTFHELREKVESVSGHVKTVQIDVMDGIFVPEKSWPYSEDKGAVNFMAHDEQGLPLWEDVTYEIDLMVDNPQDIISDWVNVCASRIVLHVESLDDPQEAMSAVRAYLDTKRGTGDYISTLELGIALDTQTPNEILHNVIDYIDFIQCMGISRIGYQGEPFDDSVVPKIKDLHKLFPDVIISVDGGVSLKTIPKLVSAGVDRLVVGSAVFGGNDIPKTIDELQTKANQ